MSNKELGKLIKDLRLKNNMTQKELGEKLHITDKAISKWERGISLPDIEMLNSIANIFKIPVSDLIDSKKDYESLEVSKNTTNSISENSKIIYIIFAILIIIIFIIAILNIKISNISYSNLDEIIVGTSIPNPDRIIYKDYKGNYYQFSSSSKKYSKLKSILQKSITSYTSSGKYIEQDEIDNIHENTSFIEFDYNTISKNYIIQLSNNEEKSVIKLATTGGNVTTPFLNNLTEITNTLDFLKIGETSYKLEYSEFTSKNYIEESALESTFFNEINSNIYQVKVESLSYYEELKEKYNINIDKEINSETFENNVIILTLYKDYNISSEVNLGNIRYTYDFSYTDDSTDDSKFSVDILIVSKIVNTNCIYNTLY